MKFYREIMTVVNKILCISQQSAPSLHRPTHTVCMCVCVEV